MEAEESDGGPASPSGRFAIPYAEEATPLPSPASGGSPTPARGKGRSDGDVSRMHTHVQQH